MSFDNFSSARDMIPMEQVREAVENRRCRNYDKGCRFQTRWHFCTCCMMHLAIGTDFFELYGRLKSEDPEFAFSMTDWQRENFDRDYEYNKKWLDNYPRGATH